MQLSLSEYSIQELIGSVISSTRSLAEEKQLELLNQVEEDLPLAFGDSKRLMQVLMNLVGNAIKFTPPGGSVTVTARCVHSSQFTVDSPEKADSELSTVNRQQVGDFIEIAVADTGIGIPATELESIFGEFRQIDSSISREYGGSGLGLSIAKRFVELHGGTIWAESQVGRGSVFHFRIPLRVRSEALV
jgi:signal transduction histidine kinase